MVYVRIASTGGKVVAERFLVCNTTEEGRLDESA